MECAFHWTLADRKMQSSQLRWLFYVEVSSADCQAMLLTYHQPRDWVLNDSITDDQLHRVLARQIVEILRLCANILSVTNIYFICTSKRYCQDKYFCQFFTFENQQRAGLTLSRYMAGRSVLVVSTSDCGVRGPRFKSHRRKCVYHDSHCDIQPWARIVQPWARVAHLYCSA